MVKEGATYRISTLYGGPHANGGANALPMRRDYEDLEGYLKNVSESSMRSIGVNGSRGSQLELHARFFHHTSFWLSNLAERVRGWDVDDVPEEW